MVIIIHGANRFLIIIDSCTVFSEPEKKTGQTFHRGLDRIRAKKGRQDGRRNTQWQADRFPKE